MKRHASLNRIYRLVWSQVLSAWVAVAETTKGRGKSSTRSKLTIAAAALFGLASLPQALAGPSGGEVAAGSGTIAQSGNATVIHQVSQNLSINWADFSIDANESVHFNQPNSSSIVLNRVLGQSVSQIHGALSANGQVFILNPNGILFGNGAQVNVGGLVASTLSLSNDDFIAGKFSFSNNGSSGSVVNRGNITATLSGYIAMLAPQVINEGVISATLGKSVLAAGNQVTLNMAQGSLVGFSIDKGAFQALVDNKQLIEADGGQIFMSAKAADAITKAMVNNTGIVEARTLANVNGRIEMISDMQNGVANVGGTMDVSAANGGDGGFIETSGAEVRVAHDAHITASAPSGNMGSWLIDPTDFTISAGSAAQTNSGMGVSTLQTALNTAHVTIMTDAQNGSDSGNINVNAALSWSLNSTLTLSAYNNININQSITAVNGKLSLQYGQGASNGTINNISANYNVNAAINLSAGENFSTQLGSGGVVKQYYVITSLGAEGSNTGQDLQGISGNLSRHFALGANIDASATSAWDGGFSPIGASSSSKFNGDFDGLGHTISGLTINRSNSSSLGLFGYGAGKISNIGLLNVDIVGNNYIGGLSGNNYGTVHNSYVTGRVSGNNYVGGLVGINYGDIIQSYATVRISGGDDLGGLVGVNYENISQSYATGNVSGDDNLGGLVGDNNNQGLITNSYATGSVSGDDDIGGLVGDNNEGLITNSYATGSVSGDDDVGGLVGENDGNISQSYATGRVIGDDDVGGLIGDSNEGLITNSYATGIVSGDDDIGGLVGENDGDISQSYATGNVSGNNDIGGLVGNNYGGLITNAYATGSVSGNNYVGGLVGNNYGNIYQGYATGNVSGNDNVGGLVGLSEEQISNSYATGNVSGNDNVGGLVGDNSGGLITNAYATGSVSGNDDIGGLVGQSNGNISQSYATGRVIGGGDVGGLIGYQSVGGSIQNSIWDTESTQNTDAIGLNASDALDDSVVSVDNQTRFNLDFNQGVLGTFGPSPNTGTWFMIDGQTRPFLQSEYSTTITNAHQLQLMAMDLDANYTLANHIDMSNDFNNISGMWATDRSSDTPTGNGFMQIGANPSSRFNGDFDGLGYTISGLTINRPTLNGVGLFGYGTGTISNIGLLNVDVLGKDYVGGLAGNNYGTVHNSYVTGAVAGEKYIGGLAGWSGVDGPNDLGVITDSHSTANVFGINKVGGLVGFSGEQISNSYATGSVTLSTRTDLYDDLSGDRYFYLGGLVGTNTGSIESSYATGDVSYISDTTIDSDVGDPNNSPNYRLNYFVGGLVGKNEGLISNSSSSGSIDSDINLTLNANFNINVDTSGFVGGLVGLNNGSIGSSHSSSNIGGQINFNNPSSYGYEDTDSNVNIGGLVGANYGSNDEDVLISNSYATGSVSSYSFGSTGGLVGLNGWGGNGYGSGGDSQISNSYATGTVSGYGKVGGFVGGLVGRNGNGYGNGYGYGSGGNSEISNSYATGAVNGSGKIGGLVGLNGSINTYSGNTRSDITHSHATGVVSGSGKLGGLVGQNGSFTSDSNTEVHSEISNSYAAGNVFGYGKVGGLVGLNGANFVNGGASSDIHNTYATGNVNGYGQVGGLVGYNGFGENFGYGNGFIYDEVEGDGNSTIRFSFATGKINYDEMSGGLIGYQGVDGSIQDSIWDAHSTEHVDAIGLNDSLEPLDASVVSVDDENRFNLSAYQGFIGTVGSDQNPLMGSWFMIEGETRPFLQSEYSTTITNAHQLQLMAMDLEADYTLANNIDMSNEFNRISGMWGTDRSEDIGAGFVPLGDFSNQFSGSFDGSGHTITGLTINRYSAPAVGLFGYGSGSINDVGLIDVDITGGFDVGGLVGFNYGTISQSYVTGDVVGEGLVGGVVGYNKSTGVISNSYADISVRGNNASGGIGGLVGSNEGLVIDSHATGSVSVLPDVGNVGGLVGRNSGEIDSSYATADVSGDSEIGGLVGKNFAAGQITESYAIADVFGAESIGGLVGENLGTVTDSYAGGGVSGGSYVGGLVGRNGNDGYLGLISNSHSRANVDANNFVGGLVGLNEGGTIDHAYATGRVSGGDYVGGLVGVNDNGSIAHSYAIANVIGEDGVGGLVGSNYGLAEIVDSYSSGSVVGVASIGGLVGFNFAGSINTSYSTATVLGVRSIGGLVGSNDGFGLIDQVFATGNVSGAEYLGGLVGSNFNGYINRAVWDKQTTGQLYSEGSSSSFGKTTNELLTQSTYQSIGWSFDHAPNQGAWFMIDGETRPFLQSEYSTTITNAHQLQLMAMDLDADYTLANNINMSNEFNNLSGMWATDQSSDIPVGRGFVPVSNEDQDFTGSFNGLGHTITGLNIYRPNTDEVGLFGSVGAEASVSNIGLINANVVGFNYAGAIAGNLNGAISNTYATGLVSGNAYIGGLVGYSTGLIRHSYSDIEVDSDDHTAGGLVGSNYGTLDYTYSIGNVFGEDRVGGLAGRNEGEIDHSYASAYVNGDSEVGGFVGMSGNTSVIYNSFWDETSDQTDGIGDGSSRNLFQLNTNNRLSKSTYTAYGWTFGTTPNSGAWFMIDGETRPFLQSEYSTSINNSHQLQLMAMDLNANYTLANNIDMSNDFYNYGGMWATNRDESLGKGFVKIGSDENHVFNGGFDGGNYSISGLYINRPLESHVAMFGLADADIANISLLDVNISSSAYVGGLVASNLGTITNSYVTGSVTGSALHVGGLAAYNQGLITGSGTDVEVSGDGVVGGLVGMNDGTSTGPGLITNSYALGDVTGTQINSGEHNDVGGLVGHNQGDVSYSYASGDVAGAGNSVGGLIGFSESNTSISNTYASGNVTGNAYLGGLVGRINEEGLVKNSYALGDVTSNSDEDYVGGLIGYSQADVSITYAKGLVTSAGSYVGGLVGWNDGGSVNTSYWNALNISGGDGDPYGYDYGALTLDEMKVSNNFEGFNFTGTPGLPNNHWVSIDADGTPNIDGGLGATTPMLASEYSTHISNTHQLQLMAMDLTAHYTLAHQIDTQNTGNANDVWNGNGFVAIGNDISRFEGRFDGMGHAISHLTITQPDRDFVGLFGMAESARIGNVHLLNIDIQGDSYVGGLVGFNLSSTIYQSSTQGSVVGSGNLGTIIYNHVALGTGGLVGFNDQGTIIESDAYVDVEGNSYVGGLVGANIDGLISQSYAMGSVDASNINSHAGGLVGYNDGTIVHAYATGPVTGNSHVGGLVGTNESEAILVDTYSASQVNGNDRVGGLVGTNHGTINQSYSTSAVNADDYVGGLVGSNYGTIAETYSTSEVIADSSVGGLVGYNNGAISNSYSLGPVTGSDYVGGLVGVNFSNGVIEKTYATGLVSASQLFGGLLGVNVGSIIQSYWDQNTTAQELAIAYSFSENNDVHSFGSMDIYDLTNYSALNSPTYSEWSFGLSPNSAAWFMVEGKTRPFLQFEYSTTIQNSHQLQLMAMDLNANYTLSRDINMASDFNNASGMWLTDDDIGSGFASIGNWDQQFTGTFNGLGNEITGLTIIEPSMSYVGLFGFTNSSSSISNLTLTDVDIFGVDAVGALVGFNDGSLNNVRVDNGTVSGSENVGGLVGVNEGTINDAHAASIYVGGEFLVGGLVGKNYSDLINSDSQSSVFVEGNSAIGGLAGHNYGEISDSFSNAEVNGQDSVGGLVGANEGSIDNSFAQGDVTGIDKVGGLVGSNLAYESSFVSITNSSAEGEVSGNNKVGGLVGSNRAFGENIATIEGSFATGAVSAGNDSNRIGGLVGLNYGGSIYESFSTSNVSAGEYSYEVGGLVGSNESNNENIGTIEYTFASGSVDAGMNSDEVGGLVGQNSGSINRSFATGDVTGDENVGGLVGQNDSEATITNAYATGLVTGNSKVGGLVGLNYDGATITNSYFETGSVSGSEKVGGLVGSNQGTLNNSFYDIENVSVNSSSEGQLNGSWYITAGGIFADQYDAWKEDLTLSIHNDSFGLIQNSDGTYRISSVQDLKNMLGFTQNSSYQFKQDANINLSSESGFYIPYLAGDYDGNDYFINGAEVNMPLHNQVGFIGDLAGNLSNVNVEIDLHGLSKVGGLVGRARNDTIISNSAVFGAVNGFNKVGGLVGSNDGGVIADSSSFVDVVGAEYADSIGGLVGSSYGGTITNVNSFGEVAAGNYSEGVGGLVGSSYGGTITNGYAIGDVTAGNNSEGVGGLVGSLRGGLVDGSNGGSFAWGDVTGGNGSDEVGGLVGVNYGGSIANSYATGDVSGNDHVGGLVGINKSFVYAGNDAGQIASISNSYATGAVFGNDYIGGLVGKNFSSLYAHEYSGSASGQMISSTISDSYATGVVSGNDYVGGLVGQNLSEISLDGISSIRIADNQVAAVINNSYSSGEVSGEDKVGGLVGANQSIISVFNAAVDSSVINNSSLVTIEDSYATGNVSGAYQVGGLVGKNISQFPTDSDIYLDTNTNLASISGTYATGFAQVDGLTAGGLVGANYGTIANSFATGTASGDSYIGGLVGYGGSGSISNSYATGDALANNQYAGGLVGYAYGSITNSYATGAVSASEYLGGLVGYNFATINDSFWNTESSGQLTGVGRGLDSGVIGLTSDAMKALSSFNAWGSSINNTGTPGAAWRVYEGRTGPLLTNFMRSLTLEDVPDLVVAYNGSVQTSQSTNMQGLLGSAASGENAGFYNGYYSTQFGYNIIGGNLTINPLGITLAGNRTYNAGTDVLANVLTPVGLVAGQTLSVTGSGSLLDKNVAVNKPLNLGTLTLGNCIGSGCVGLSANYYLESATVTITPKTIVQSGLSVAPTKVYDAGISATVMGYPVFSTKAIATGTDVDGLAYTNDDVSITGNATGTYNSKNVAQASTVTFGGLSLSGADSGNYLLEMQPDATASILKADAVVTARSARRYYNGSTHILTGFTAQGLVGNETVNVLTGVSATGSGLEVGAYPVIASGTDGNYNLTFVDGVLDILKPTTNAALASVADLFGTAGKSNSNPAVNLSSSAGNEDNSKSQEDNITLPDDMLTALPETNSN